MINYAKITLGVLLIVLGFLFLGNNYDWFSIDLSFRKVAQWWPLLLVLAGFGVFLNPERRVGNPLSILSIAFAIPLALFSFADEGIQKVSDKFDERLEFDDSPVTRSEKEGKSDEGANSSDQKNRLVQHYNVPNEIGLTKAKLDFGGGAAEFYLQPTTNYLFEADTRLATGSYKLTSDRLTDEMDINFEMIDKQNRDINIDGENEFDNDVYLKLNPKVVWELKMGIGAGDLDFDLSKFRVNRLKVETGIAAVKLKLSDLLDESNVEVKSGIAKITLDVPKNVGCRINLEGAMNSKTFAGFKKIGNNRWETDNFDTAQKKIYIDLESGLSSITVTRY